MGPANPWDTAGGDFVPAASATQSISGTGGYSFGPATLAADLQAWLDNPGTNFGWLLRSESEATLGSIRRFIGRRDTGSPPQLTVDYFLGASPVPAPVITEVAQVGNQIRFSFDAESNRTYTVEFRDSLTAGSWKPLINLPAQPARTMLHITNLLSSAERYFRVSTP